MAVAPNGDMKLRADEHDDDDERFVDDEEDQEERDGMECEGAAGESERLKELISRYQEGQDWDDEDEDEDEDWQPHSSSDELHSRWFCTNCTRANPEENTHCRLCGEHRRSGILNEGHFANAHTAAEDERPWSSRGKQSKRTALGFDERMLLHSEVQMKSIPHPERPDRLRSILSAFQTAGLYPGGCISILPREVTRAEAEAVHTGELVDAVEATSESEFSYFTTDTYANKYTSLAVRIAGGICADLALAVLSGRVDNGFALVRPPGHHAEHDKAMGFCMHNNASIAAKAAQAAGAKKVLIVDWDVHHGNGTQEIFERDPSVLYISLHRYEGGLFYPGTGGTEEVGSGPGEGFSVNIPWGCAGIGDNDYILAFLHIVLPIARQFAPDMTIVSAGFDCAKGDPLGGCEVTPTGFAQMTQLLTSLCDGKLLVILEGGYNLRSISASATAVLKVLVGDAAEKIPDDIQPSEAGLATLLEVFVAQMRYWPSLVVPPSILRLASQHSTDNGDLKAREPKRRRISDYYWGVWGRRKRHLLCML